MFETLIWTLLGTTFGFTGGYLYSHFKQIKSELLYTITTIKEDVINLTVKVEQHLSTKA